MQLDNISGKVLYLPKPQLNEVLRRVTGKGRDLARNSRQDILDAVQKLPTPDVEAAMASLGLIPGSGWAQPQAAPGAAPAAPAALPEAAPAPVEQQHDVRVVSQSTLGKVFGIRGKAASIVVDVWNDPAAPKLDPGYKFKTDQLVSAMSAIKRGRNVWLAGPAGTGKTEFVKNLCAGLGRAFIRVSFDSSSERYELIGGERVRNGSTVYQRGVILQGMTRPGAVVLLDEVGFARPEYLSALHAVLEPEGAVTIPETGEVIRRADGVVFFAADNSNGTGDSTGMYAGVREMNRAFISRFAKTIVFTYLAEGVEAWVIANRSGCTPALAALIVKFLGVARQAGRGAQLDYVPALREAFALAEALTDGQKPRLAYEETIVNRATVESQEVLQQLWAANINDADIDAALADTASASSADSISEEG